MIMYKKIILWAVIAVSVLFSSYLISTSNDDTQYMTAIYEDDGLLGADTPRRPTEFKSSLNEQKSEGHSDTTLKVTSISTKDGNTLSGDILGDWIVLSINPGSSNSEIVGCTGLTTSTKTFTGCTFGYRFDDPTATSSANIKSHGPGEPVIISNTDTYNTEQFLTVDGDATLAGDLTFSGSNTSTGSHDFQGAVDFDLLPTTTTTAPTDNAQIASKKYVDDTAFAGAPDSSLTVKGIVELATGAEAAANTAIGGGGTTAPLCLYSGISTSTPSGTGNYVVVTESDLKINQSFYDLTEAFAWLGVHTFSATTTVNAPFIVSGATTTLATTTVSGVDLSPLIDGSDADSLHVHSEWKPILFATTTNKGTTDHSGVSLISITIPGGTLGTDNIIRLTSYGTYSNESGDSMALNLKYGSTSFSSLSSSFNSGKYKFTSYLMGAGSASAQKNVSELEVHYLHPTGNNGQSDTIQSTSSEDSTGDLSLDLVYTHGSSYTSSITTYNILVEVLTHQ